jgi:predicted RNase H-like HicB family nuclease
MNMRFLVMIYRYKGDYSAMVPDLPGCVAAAATVEDVRDLITEAIALHLDMMRKSGERLPKPRQKMQFAVGDDAEEEFCTWVDVPLRKAAKVRG